MDGTQTWYVKDQLHVGQEQQKPSRSLCVYGGGCTHTPSSVSLHMEGVEGSLVAGRLPFLPPDAKGLCIGFPED